MRARTGSHDLVVLDLMLPGLDGFRVLDTLRAERITTPVLVLTARGDESDKVRGLRSGADDYVTKPFALRELLARVEALLRRARPAAEERPQAAHGIRFGDVAVNPTTRVVTRGGRPVPLRPKEYDLLGALLRREGGVVGRADLLREVWGYHESVAEPDPRHPRRRAAPEARGRPRRPPPHPHRQESRLPSRRSTPTEPTSARRVVTPARPRPSGAMDVPSRYYRDSPIIGE